MEPFSTRHQKPASRAAETVQSAEVRQRVARVTKRTPFSLMVLAPVSARLTAAAIVFPALVVLSSTSSLRPANSARRTVPGVQVHQRVQYAISHTPCNKITHAHAMARSAVMVCVGPAQSVPTLTKS